MPSRFASSLAVDAGNNAAVPPDSYDLDGDGNTSEPLPLDLGGLPRVVDGDGDGTATVDMGAYEYDGPPFLGVLYVDDDALVGGDGLSWATAFSWWVTTSLLPTPSGSSTASTKE